MKLTDAEIAELEQMERAATPGPWRSDWRGTNHFEITSPEGGSYWVVQPGHNCCDDENPRWDAAGQDLDLIAAMRNALPALLEERRALREALRSTLAEMEKCRSRAGDGDDDSLRRSILSTRALLKT